MPCPTECHCNWEPTERNERLDEMIRLLHNSANYVDNTPGRDGITGQEHALRIAGMAAARGNREQAFVGLVHDLARPLNDVHHGEVVAEMVRDRVSAGAYEVLRTHGSFQSAIVHEHPYPDAPEEWRRNALQLAGFEVRSFAGSYHGPTLTVDEGIQLLTEFLG